MVTFTIIRYPLLFFPFAFVAMAIHRLPLMFSRKITFFKLLGCGKNGSFSVVPSLRQWGLLAVHRNEPSLNDQLYGTFISRWWKLFGCEVCHFKMQSISSHGKWDGKEPFPVEEGKGLIHRAIITRATIRRGRAGAFWKYVKPVSEELRRSPGILFSTGIGEVPWLRQATFSLWNSEQMMRSFAYGQEKHVEVIRKTHKDNWYSEDLYARFEVLETKGTVKGKNPLEVLS